jgi:hypothetical protein
LAFAAAEAPFNVKEFRRALVKKLKRVRYPQPPEKGVEGKKFYVHLARANALDALKESSTLREIWNSLLIPQIVKKDRELQEKKLAVTGMPRSFHRKAALDILVELNKLEVSGDTRDIFDPFQREQLHRMFRENVRVFLTARRRSGPYVKLLGGSPKKR